MRLTFFCQLSLCVLLSCIVQHVDKPDSGCFCAVVGLAHDNVYIRAVEDKEGALESRGLIDVVIKQTAWKLNVSQ